MKKIFSILLIALLFGCAGKTTSNSNPNSKNNVLADSHFKMGLAYLNTKEDYMAVREFKQAISINPNNDRYYYALSTFYIKKQRLIDAKENILKALKLNPNESEYINTYASILAAEGNVEEAIKQWKRVLNDPGYPAAAVVNYNIGLALYNLGRFQEATQYLSVTVKTNPKVISPALLLYRSYLKAGNLKDAENTLLAASMINPTALELKMELGKFYYENNRYQDAAKYFSEIVDSKDNYKYVKEARSYLNKMGIYNE